MFITYNRLFEAIIGVVFEAVYTYPTTRTIMFLTCIRLFVAIIGVVFTRGTVVFLTCSILLLTVNGVVFYSVYPTYIRLCFWHAKMFSWQSLVSFLLSVPYKRYGCVLYLQHTVRDCQWCRFLLSVYLPYSNITNIVFPTYNRLFAAVIDVIFNLFCT